MPVNDSNTISCITGSLTTTPIAYCGTYSNTTSSNNTSLSDYFEVKSVTINPPYTTITWKNGEITKCKCTDGDEYDIRKGVEICYLKRIFKDQSYNKQINKVVNKGKESYTKKLKRQEKAIQKKLKEVNGVNA